MSLNAFKIENLEPFGVILHLEGKSIDELDHHSLRALLHKEKVVLIRGNTLFHDEKFIEWGDRFPAENGSAVLEWASGKVFHLKADPDPKNYIFSREDVPLHWDGAFFVEPSILVFNCHRAPGRNAGGETYFVNSEALLEDLNSESRVEVEGLEINLETEKLAHYGGKVKKKVTHKHPHTGRLSVRYADQVQTLKNPVQISYEHKDESVDVSRVVSDLKEYMHRPEYRFEHQWEVGDVLLADNHALLHGRNGFQQETDRLIKRIQIR